MLSCVSGAWAAYSIQVGNDSATCASGKAGAIRWNGSAVQYCSGSAWGALGASQWTTTGSDIYYTTGKVGIGTASPSYSLHVNGPLGITSASAAVSLVAYGAANQYAASLAGSATSGQSYGVLVSAGTNSSDTSFYVRNYLGTVPIIFARGDGNVGIGTTSPTYKITAVASGGTAYLADSGVWVNASDRRLKDHIEPIQYGLDTVKQLKPASYRIRATGQQQIGFIAQDVERLIPEVVGQVATADMPDQRTLSYDQLVPVTVRAIQELEAENEQLRHRIDTLEATTRSLVDRLSRD